MATETRPGAMAVIRIQGTVFGTEAFVRVMGMPATTWRQRVFNNETALAFGFPKPAIPAVFGPLDVCMTGTVNTATYHHKVEMKEVARLVREKWRELTLAIARAERDLWEKPGVLRVPAVPTTSQQFFAISSTADKKKVFAGVGTMLEAINQVDGQDRTTFMLPFQAVVRTAYEMAEEAKVEFPSRLCPDPDDAKAWGDWIEAIEDFRDVAGMMRAKARAKKRKVTA